MTSAPYVSVSSSEFCKASPIQRRTEDVYVRGCDYDLVHPTKGCISYFVMQRLRLHVLGLGGFNSSSTRAELRTRPFNGALPKLGSSSKSGSPPTCPPEAHGTASRTRPGRDRGAASGSLVLCTEPTQPQNRPASPSQHLTCGVASGRHARSTGPDVVSSATFRRSSLNIWTVVAGRATFKFLRVCVTVSTSTQAWRGFWRGGRPNLLFCSRPPGPSRGLVHQ